MLATQNPMDVDCRALSNAGMWFVGRLQTDADRARVVEGLVGAGGASASAGARDLAARIKVLAPRWFIVRDLHASDGVMLAESRCTLAWMRGPMTRHEIAKMRAAGLIASAGAEHRAAL